MATGAVDGIWYWKSNANPFSPTEPAKWSRFSDIENEIIEDAFQHNEKEVLLDNHSIDFKLKLQINKSDKTRQRPILRKSDDPNQQFAPRETRFNIVDMPVKTFTEAGGFSKFLWEWANKYNDSCCILTEQNAPGIVERAVEGIIKEGETISKTTESKWIAKQLSKVKNRTLADIGKCCIVYYTKESFLYHVVNDVLRRENLSKLETLGPYCFLLINALWNCRDSRRHTQRVYRGCKLERDQIEQYKSDIDKVRCWSAFSSTTKRRDIATSFGAESNTLFIIDLVERPFTESFGLDISAMSKYPHEEEVLLPAGINFVVEKVELDKKTNKYTIYLTI
ncbi:unnamed protein product [Didymodactylos carnosus]|uniref:NAD(P)(+)--arginine ADP-ribosyltransferase n=1 Tax=Didymodactylos carnosus TaxID=1234261 RepID=A0A816AMJ8_9BILA|nr:unnamed protein product [Didymodactylos carnosus]CAF1599523.1 unnamed protein product [Didymodactylos carnosus]CAF4205373.1 unnamed protein product [Didymodactylos carnosus]CAF4476107.1 unnamed protein product [Didymodactylos carnosus]